MPAGQNGHRSLAAAVAEFLDETKLTKKPKTLAAYTTALNYFTESCPKLYLDEIERKDLLKFSAFLRDEKEQAPRSVRNKFENVMTFLKAKGFEVWLERTTGHATPKRNQRSTSRKNSTSSSRPAMRKSASGMSSS